MRNTSQFDKLFSSRAEIGIRIIVTLSVIFRIQIVCSRVNHSTWLKSTPNSKSLATFSLDIAWIGTQGVMRDSEQSVAKP